MALFNEHPCLCQKPIRDKTGLGRALLAFCQVTENREAQAGLTFLYSQRLRTYSEDVSEVQNPSERGWPMFGLIFLGILVLLILFGIGMYNGLVRLKVQCDNAWADIDVQLKRRYDLIPNLVETVKGYAAHERGTLEAVINARNRAMSATGPADKAQAENMLSGALKSLFALSEAYPQLRAIESFTSLQNSLSEIEDTVQNARRYYNAVVRDLNTKILQFPTNIFAGMLGFKQREFFEVASAAEREAPKVSFGNPAAPTA
jgi:LemA protein